MFVVGIQILWQNDLSWLFLLYLLPFLKIFSVIKCEFLIFDYIPDFSCDMEYFHSGFSYLPEISLLITFYTVHPAGSSCRYLLLPVDYSAPCKCPRLALAITKTHSCQDGPLRMFPTFPLFRLLNSAKVFSIGRRGLDQSFINFSQAPKLTKSQTDK